MTSWLLEARVCTYDTRIGARTLAAGCFARSLAERYPPLHWHHEITHGIGIAVSHRDTAEALEITFRIPDSFMGARIVQQVESGQLAEFSVGFGTADKHRVTHGVLDEVSIVYRGACAGTRVLSLTSVEEPSVATTDIEREVDEILEAHECRYGRARAFDPLEFWVGEAERRARVS